MSDRHSYQRWDGTLDEIEGPARHKSRTGNSDQVGLTGVNMEDFGTTTDTECAAVAKGDLPRAGGPFKAPPETGIMKTVSADVTY